MIDADPLILTLAFDEPTFARFDGERRRHFPEALNRIPAHATLFHHLPGDRERGVIEAITALARTVPPPEVAVVTGLRFTGRGVAYALDSDALARFRARLAQEFAAHLTAQDRQGWRPHVTVQNKVSPDTARALQRRPLGRVRAVPASPRPAPCSGATAAASGRRRPPALRRE